MILWAGLYNPGFMIQLNRLEGFYWVARTGGYSSAARAFPYPITQPAVHQQVKKLEKEVGIPLFERIGKDDIKLTSAGRQLFEFVEPLYGGLVSLLRSLRAGDLGGELRLHAAALFMRHLMPAWLRRLHAKRPDIHVDLQDLTRLDCGPLLRGEADMIVAVLPEIPKGLEFVQVGTVYAFLVLPANHRLAGKANITVRDLKDETFIAYTSGTPVHKVQMEELRRHDVRPAHMITTDSIDTILGFVESGIGYSLVASIDLEGPRLSGIVARLLPGKHNRYPVVAAWRTSSSSNPLVQAALETAPEV